MKTQGEGGGWMFKSYDEMLEELEREMRRVSGMTGELWTPRVDVYETAENIIVKVCAAGLAPDQMELSISSDNKFLTLRGMRIEQDDDKSDRIRYYQLEVYYGPFERIVALPAEVSVDRDRLTATYKDGFLKVVLPKRQPGSKGAKIEIED